MTNVCMLTTIDNPYDPFKDFDKWFVYDVTNGYNTCGLLARVSHTADNQAKGEYDEAIEEAIDSILDCDFTGMYMKVVKKEGEGNGNTEADPSYSSDLLAKAKASLNQS